ncbi:hypothetical protein MMON44395_10645 [Mycolicibacterium monacense DSM 44395]|nr:hypothetical protein [Mycolicibacterium monacense DSM 44395]
MTRPHVEQADRDLIDDHDVPEPQPAHDEENR